MRRNEKPSDAMLIPIKSYVQEGGNGLGKVSTGNKRKSLEKEKKEKKRRERKRKPLKLLKFLRLSVCMYRQGG